MVARLQYSVTLGRELRSNWKMPPLSFIFLRARQFVPLMVSFKLGKHHPFSVCNGPRLRPLMIVDTLGFNATFP